MISAKTIDKAYKFYLNQPLASPGTRSDIYNNLWVFLTGRSVMSPHPHRHFIKEEFIPKIKSDKAFRNFCLPKLDLNNLRNFQSKMKSYDRNHDSKEKIVRFSYIDGKVNRIEYFISHTTLTGKIISRTPHRISNGFDRSCLYNFIPTGKESYSLFCFSTNENIGHNIFMRKLKKVLKEKFDDVLTLDNYASSLKPVNQ